MLFRSLIREGEDPTLLGQVVKDAARKGHEFDTARLSVLLNPLSTRSGYEDGESFACMLLSKNAGDVQKERFRQILSALQASRGEEGIPALHLNSRSHAKSPDSSTNPERIQRLSSDEWVLSLALRKKRL